MQHRSRFARHLCIAVDAASYGALDSVAQYDVQAVLSDALDEAAAAAGLDRSRWSRQAQGDGELALVPPDQPEPRIVDDFIRELDAALRLRNHGRIRAACLRLRVAVDFGVAYEAPFGFAGEAVVATARLLASDSLHRALAGTAGADLAVALSARVYQTILDRHTSIDPGQFTRAGVTEKEYRGDAWIRVLPPGGPAAAAAPAGEQSGSAAASGGPRQPEAPAPVRRYTVENTFQAPVDAGVIGISFGALPGEQA